MLRTVAILWPNQMIYDSMITECSLVDPFLCARCTVSPKITETWDCGFQPRSKAKRSHDIQIPLGVFLCLAWYFGEDNECELFGVLSF